MVWEGEAAHRHSVRANGSYTALPKAQSANYAAATSNLALSASVACNASDRVMGSLGVASNVGSSTAIASVFGGLASEASGGSFVDGAVSAAFTHLFNHKAGRIFTFKTRIGSVLQLSVDGPKQSTVLVKVYRLAIENEIYQKVQIMRLEMYQLISEYWMKVLS